MADLSVTPVATQIKPPQPMSLADIMNIARGAQAYQQAQQINPLAVQQQQAATQEAQARASVQSRSAEEQTALAPILKDLPNHLDEDGNIDWNYAIPKILDAAPTTGDKYIANLTIAAKGATEAKKAVIGLNQDQRTAVSQQFQGIDPANPGPGLQAISEWSDKNPWAKPIIQQALQYHIVPALTKDVQSPDPKNPHANFNQEQTHMIETVLNPAQRAETMKESGVPISFGSGGQVTSTNPFAQTPVGQAIPGTEYTQGNAPAYVAGYEGIPTARPGVGGGIKGGQPQGNQPAGGTQPVVPQGVSAPRAPVAGGATLAPFPGETKENYAARQTDIYKKGDLARADMDPNNAFSPSNMLRTNDLILNMLNDPKLETGPIAQLMANKTANVSLTPEQQTIAKYLEQRARQIASRSNQDQESVHTAMGSFGTNKDTLREILYRDKGVLNSNLLWSQGLLNRQGSPNTPNLGAMNEFNQGYISRANPQLIHLMGIIGDKNLNQLTQADKNAIRNNFSGLTSDQFDTLLKQRSDLLNYVRGNQ